LLMRKNLKKLKIGISIWTFAPNTGGLQTHAENLCHYLMARGHKVSVITRSATRSPVQDDYLFFNEPSDDIQVADVPVRPIRLSHVWPPVLWTILKTQGRRPFRPLAAWLYELVTAEQAALAYAGFDLVHHVGHATALAAFSAANAARRHGVPFLVQPTVHPFQFGDDPVDFKLYRRADRLLVHTEYERDYLRSRGISTPMDVVFNGIVDRADGQGARFRQKHGIQGPLILFLGRKEVDKGYPLLIEAFKIVHTRMPECRLVCIGPSSGGSENPSTQGVLELKFVSEEEKHDALAACTCLCVPSVGESFGLVYMEAGRYGKPVVGRRLPVLEELLGKKNAALLLGRAEPELNRVQLDANELANGILQLLEDTALCRQIGENCRQVSESYLWPRVADNFEQAYYRALGEKELR
jgi:glycosyltransferase involved in cell wall biosynthesis